MQDFPGRPAGRPVFIAVEGATGAGKTTLATRLARRTGAVLALDPFDQNLFLPAYCQAPPGQWDELSLPLEMGFLALRVGALRGIARHLSGGRSVVADWALVKSRVFAALTLSAADAGMLTQTADLWTAGLPQPGLIVYLRADARTLEARVRARGRVIETNVTASELAIQDRLFGDVLDGSGLKVMIVDIASFDAFSDRDMAALTSALPHAARTPAA
jgi:deoxyguanosine kinase